MNLLEYYIKEVYSVDQLPDDKVRVDVKTDCWGSVERIQLILSQGRWEQVQRDGYILM